jgi:hypothetical protein
MFGEFGYVTTALFALVVGSVAGTMAVLTWDIFRESTFGTAIIGVAVAFSIFTLHHVFLLSVEPRPAEFRSYQALLNTVVVIFVGLMIRHRNRLRAATEESRT